MRDLHDEYSGPDTNTAADIDQLTRRLLEAESSLLVERSHSIDDDVARLTRQVNGWRHRYGLNPLPNPLEV